MITALRSAEARLAEIRQAHEAWVARGLTREGEARFVNAVLVAVFESDAQRDVSERLYRYPTG